MPVKKKSTRRMKGKTAKQFALKEWFTDLSIFWKSMIVGIVSVGAVIGAYQQIQASIVSKTEIKNLETINNIVHKKMENVHDKDIAEVSSAFQNYQIRQEIRSVDKDIKVTEVENKKNPSEDKERELNRLKIQKEELQRDLDDVKMRQRQQTK